MLEAEEQLEISKILGQLTDFTGSREREIILSMEAMLHYDLIFAKANYSRVTNGREPNMNVENRIRIVEGRHPLLGQNGVPLHFSLGENYQALVITGPNTGGKTVAIKTVGLLTLMVQSGIHVPVGEESEFAVFQEVLADIGDGQSIEQSLSTFSSHITNIISILKTAGPRSLILVDELGAGTDPAEGMGLAVSILEHLYSKGASILATTHYSEIKEFASTAPGFENGSMEFNLHSLQPTYRLILGKAGESQAFSIAQKLGMDYAIIERASEITYKRKRNEHMEDLLFEEEKTLKRAVHAREAALEKMKKAPESTSQQKTSNSHPVFKAGDRVYVSSLKAAGVIFEGENRQGEYGVIINGKKLKIHKKRLKLHIKREDLYTETTIWISFLKPKKTVKKPKW